MPWCLLWYAQLEQIRNFSCQVCGQPAKAAQVRKLQCYAKLFLSSLSTLLDSNVSVGRLPLIFLWIHRLQIRNWTCPVIVFLLTCVPWIFFSSLYILRSSQHGVILLKFAHFWEKEGCEVYLFPVHWALVPVAGTGPKGEDETKPWAAKHATLVYPGSECPLGFNLMGIPIRLAVDPNGFQNVVFWRTTTSTSLGTC